MTDTTGSPPSTIRIGILGTGNTARALGSQWAERGHTVTIGGRSIEKARAVATDIGFGTQFGSLDAAVVGADVVLLALPWTALDDVLARIGSLAGTVVIDPTNPVEHGVGKHALDVGSVAERIASGARVVKAFNVHPATYWESARAEDLVVIAGDDRSALDVVSRLVEEIGATPHVIGGLDRARQVEELAGTVIALAFGGVDPRHAVPGR